MENVIKVETNNKTYNSKKKQNKYVIEYTVEYGNNKLKTHEFVCNKKDINSALNIFNKSINKRPTIKYISGGKLEYTNNLSIVFGSIENVPNYYVVADKIAREYPKDYSSISKCPAILKKFKVIYYNNEGIKNNTTVTW